MKKSLSLLLCLILLFGLLPLTAPARAESEEDWEYTVYSDYTEITKYTGTGGKVTIPSSLGGKPVTEIGKYAFFNNNDLTSVTIPNSVTSIGYGAFDCCNFLTSVTIPNSVTSIDSDAFFGCTHLPSVTIPNSVTCIGSGAFRDCYSLTNVTISGSVTCIGDSVFCNCRSLTRVTIPNSVTSIDLCAFYGCSSLVNVTIPSSVTSIGLQAFDNCTSLTNISIPSSVTEISDRAFRRCTGLTSINVESGNAQYCSVNGVLFSKDKTQLIQFPAGKTGSYSIPSSVTSIGVGAFEDCTGLTSVSIPSSVTDIWPSAFSGCTGLTSAGPVGSGCSIEFGWTDIPLYAFSGCTNLTNLTIPSSVTSIGLYAFDGCTGLTSITIPSSVTNIGSYAFNGCTSLTSINVDSGNAQYCSVNGVLYSKKVNWLFQYPAGKTGSYSIPSSVTSIGWNAFEGCIGLTSITIPSNVIEIFSSAFSGCSGLTDVYYGGTAEEWAEVRIYSDNDPLTSAAIHYNYYNYSENPILVSATAAPGQITVTWNAVSGATKYAVYRKTASGSWTLLTTAVTGTSYVDKSSELVAGTTYYYTVKSLVSGTWSGYDGKGVSAAAASTTPVLAGATASAGQITVTWNAVNGATKYAVYRKTAGGSWTLLTTSATGTSYVDKSAELVPGTVYYYTVKSLVNGTWSGYDNKGVSAAAASTTPVLKSATAAAAGQITVQWNAVANATKYAVYRKTASSSWTLLTTAVTGTSYVDKSSELVAGTTYYYTVKSLVNGTWSGYDSKGVSAAAAATTPVLAGATASAGQITVQWNGVSGASKYAVYRKTAGGSWTLLTTSATGTSYVDKSIAAATTYSYTVKALVGGTWSGYDSKGVSATTAPILKSAIAAAGQITVTWNAVPGASKYAVYRKVAGGSWTLLTTSATGSSYVDKSTELVVGTVYTYTVKSLVNGAWSGYDGKGVSATAVAAASTTPVLVSATASAGQITVTWNPVSGASKYAVYRKTAGGNWTLLTTSATGNSYVDKSSELKAGTTYYYTVKSLVNGAWSGYDGKGVSAMAK